jgi:hypothetical protein
LTPDGDFEPCINLLLLIYALAHEEDSRERWVIYIDAREMFAIHAAPKVDDAVDDALAEALAKLKGGAHQEGEAREVLARPYERRQHEGRGLAAGDVALVELGGRSKDGELCVAFTATGHLVVRRFRRLSNKWIELKREPPRGKIQVFAPRAVFVFGLVVGIEKGGAGCSPSSTT